MKNRHSLFDWVNLLATVSIPIALGIFTILQSKSQLDQHKMELQIANESRTKDLFIAEKNRQHDKYLADDQQKETVLSEYENFLVKFLLENDLKSNRNPSARLALRMKTLAALDQINPTRRSFLIRSLYEAGFIQCINKTDTCQSIIDLRLADLTGINIGFNCDYEFDINDDKIEYTDLQFRMTTLRNASFCGVDLSSSIFTKARLDYARFSHIVGNNKSHILLDETKLTNAIFNHVVWYSALFNHSNLTLTEFHVVHMSYCSFSDAYLLRSLFDRTSINNSIFRGSVLRSITFFNSTIVEGDWGFARISDQSYLKYFNVYNSTLADISIVDSTFVDGQLINVSFNRAHLENLKFAGMSMIQINLIDAYIFNCTFINVYLVNCNLAVKFFCMNSFFHTDLTNCTGFTDEMIGQSRWFENTILPNGTVFTSTTSLMK